MAVKINIYNQNKKRKINLARVRRVVKTVLRNLRKENIELNILLTDNTRIRKFNQKYLNKNLVTDVLAFPFYDPLSIIHYPLSIGDIVVSLDKAAQNAKTYKATFMEETLRYIIHGILHLEGYNDLTKKTVERMRKKEDELLQKVKKIY